jgi:hypothetical protein
VKPYDYEKGSVLSMLITSNSKSKKRIITIAMSESGFWFVEFQPGFIMQLE